LEGSAGSEELDFLDPKPPLEPKPPDLDLDLVDGFTWRRVLVLCLWWPVTKGSGWGWKAQTAWEESKMASNEVIAMGIDALARLRPHVALEAVMVVGWRLLEDGD